MRLLGRPADDVRRELVASYLSDLGIDRVAAKHGVTKSAVRYALRKYHVPLRSRSEGYAIQSRVPKKHYEAIRDAYLAGTSACRLAVRYGVSHSSIERVLTRMGVVLRSSAPKYKLPPAARYAAVQLSKRRGTIIAGKAFGVHHTTVLMWRRRMTNAAPPTQVQRSCDGCGNPATARFCDWCSLVA